MPKSTTISGLKQMIRADEIRPGDLVLFRDGERGILNWMIRRAQGRMIRDLNGELPRDVVTWAAAYTHAACVFDGLSCAEMYYPRARTQKWEDKLPFGARILVRRPRSDGADIARPMGCRIAGEALEDVAHETPYPMRELLVYYLWSWGFQKLGRGRHFSDVFTAKETDVCSGRYWLWCRRAGAFADAAGTLNDRPEAWYPARLAVSPRFRTVGEFVIQDSASPGVSTPPSSLPRGRPFSMSEEPLTMKSMKSMKGEEHEDWDGYVVGRGVVA